jgi:hypothetical protein
MSVRKKNNWENGFMKSFAIYNTCWILVGDKIKEVEIK